MIIEFHDDAVENETEGTLSGSAGRDGTIECAYQVEMWVQEMMCPGSKTLSRAYAHEGGVLYAVWYRRSDGKMYYIGRNPGYSGEWELPFVHEELDRLETVYLGDDVQSLEEAEQKALEKMNIPRVASVVVLDARGILAAWEHTSRGVLLVAKNPRPALLTA